MKGTTALAVAVCIACFGIGYLFYVGMTLVVDVLVTQVDPCRNSVEVCGQQQPGLKR